MIINRTGPILVVPDADLDRSAVRRALEGIGGPVEILEDSSFHTVPAAAEMVTRLRASAVVMGLDRGAAALPVIAAVSALVPVLICTPSTEAHLAAESCLNGAVWFGNDTPVDCERLHDQLPGLLGHPSPVVEARLYHGLFENMLNGFAYHRIIVNDAGEPVDFVFLAANEVFEAMTGLDRNLVLGRSIRESQPGFDENDLHWVKLYGEVAIHGGSKSLEEWSENLQRWLEIRVFSPEHMHFAVVFNDITERKKREAQLQGSLEQKNTLLEEIHHRVKNNMQIIDSMVSLQARVAGTTLDDVVQRSHERIHAMAMAHERLYRSEDREHVELRRYVADLVRDLVQYQYHGPVMVSDGGEEVLLSADALIPLGLIVAEVVNNSVKYGYRDQPDAQRRIDVEVRRRPGPPTPMYELLIADNGTGVELPAGTDEQSIEAFSGPQDSLGMRLVANLAAQIGGEALIRTERGTTVLVRFPNMS